MTYYSRHYVKSLSTHFYRIKPCYITFRQGQQAPHCRQPPRMTRAPQKWDGEREGERDVLRDVFGHPAWYFNGVQWDL